MVNPVERIPCPFPKPRGEVVLQKCKPRVRLCTLCRSLPLLLLSEDDTEHLAGTQCYLPHLMSLATPEDITNGSNSRVGLSLRAT